MFVALALPDDAHAALGTVIDVLRDVNPEARWVPVGNLHVTLSFLGAVEDERVGGIIAALEPAVAAVAGGRARLAGLGAFPSVRHARVLWAGLEEDGAIEEAAAAARRALEPLGFEPERRRFSAHVTLARLRAPARANLAVPVPPVEVVVDAVTVFESRLGGGPARYEALARLSLGPTRDA